ncbi:MAG: CYTH and CHAD domain-containing protein [Candidatus Eremiobacteraeota bacterium]|nr:CYTH and CHAD domain-containing protein [Candidatus Eremiobacteraeota bacterium]
MKTHLEQEVKLQVPRRFDLQLLEQGLDGYTASPVQARTLTTVYYDTDDLRLIRWGCSLRHRKGEGWTLKLPAGGGPGGALRRFEHVFPEEGSKPPAEALELVTAFVRGKPVVPVIKLRTLRKSVRLHGAAGEEIAEVVDDDVRVLQDGHVADRFREVEVELVDGAPESVLAELTEWLQNAGAGGFDETPKAVRALGPAAKAPTELHLEAVTPDSDAATLVRNALMSSVEQLLRHDALLRLHADPEIVHKARVATRRLRSDLRSLMPLLDEEWARSLRSRIQWLADELGSVRDADVLLARLRRDASQLPATDGQAAEAVTDRFAAQSTAARERLKNVLREERYVTLLDELVRSAADPKLGPHASALAADVLPALVDEPWRKLCRAIHNLEPEPPDDKLHQVRIKAKRCRYAAEAIAPVCGKDAKRFARRVAKLQTILGDLHDAVVADSRLRQVTGDRDDVFVAGELAGMQATAAAEARSSWRDAWKKASKKDLRFWM